MKKTKNKLANQHKQQKTTEILLKKKTGDWWQCGRIDDA